MDIEGSLGFSGCLPSYQLSERACLRGIKWWVIEQDTWCLPLASVYKHKRTACTHGCTHKHTHMHVPDTYNTHMQSHKHTHKPKPVWDPRRPVFFPYFSEQCTVSCPLQHPYSSTWMSFICFQNTQLQCFKRARKLDILETHRIRKYSHGHSCLSPRAGPYPSNLFLNEKLL